MESKRSKFDKDFKTKIVELVKWGKSVDDVCCEYDLIYGLVLRWGREFYLEIVGFKDEHTLVLEQ